MLDLLGGGICRSGTHSRGGASNILPLQESATVHPCPSGHHQYRYPDMCDQNHENCRPGVSSRGICEHCHSALPPHSLSGSFPEGEGVMQIGHPGILLASVPGNTSKSPLWGHLLTSVRTDSGTSYMGEGQVQATLGLGEVLILT